MVLMIGATRPPSFQRILKLIMRPLCQKPAMQIEARVLAHHAALGEAGFLYFEVQRLRVPAHPAILDVSRTRIDIDAWSPLFYIFRHYFGKGARHGKSFRAKYRATISCLGATKPTISALGRCGRHALCGAANFAESRYSDRASVGARTAGSPRSGSS